MDVVEVVVVVVVVVGGVVLGVGVGVGGGVGAVGVGVGVVGGVDGGVGVAVVVANVAGTFASRRCSDATTTKSSGRWIGMQRSIADTLGLSSNERTSRRTMGPRRRRRPGRAVKSKEHMGAAIGLRGRQMRRNNPSRISMQRSGKRQLLSRTNGGHPIWTIRNRPLGRER